MDIEPWRMAIIVICVAILLSGGGNALFSFGSLGYSVGHEGVKASFVGIEYNAGGSSGRADLSGMSFTFDADDPLKYAPNIVAEMTNAFVPEESIKPSWVFEDMWTGVQYIKNPVESTQWDLPNPDVENETIAYVMEEWLLRMYVSVTAEWDSPWSTIDDPTQEYYGRYQNTEIWIELDISPTWYFSGADQVYFGLAKVVCSEYAEGRLGTTDEGYVPTTQFSVAPTKSSYRYLYRQKYAEEEVTPTNPKTYQGRVLNPEIFTDRMFIKLDLNNFGVDTWMDMPFSRASKGDAVTWGFDVHVFVVGQWKVQDISEIPTDYGRDPMVQRGLSYYIAKFLSDPRAQFWLILGVFALIFLVLAIFAPWVLIAIFGMISAFRGGSSGKRRKG